VRNQIVSSRPVRPCSSSNQTDLQFFLFFGLSPPVTPPTLSLCFIPVSSFGLEDRPLQNMFDIMQRFLISRNRRLDPPGFSCRDRDFYLARRHEPPSHSLVFFFQEPSSASPSARVVSLSLRNRTPSTSVQPSSMLDIFRETGLRPGALFPNPLRLLLRPLSLAVTAFLFSSRSA